MLRIVTREAGVANADDQILIKEFRLSKLAEEFEIYSQAEIERLRGDNPGFDEKLYQEAVALVFRKLSQNEPNELNESRKRS